LEEGPREFIPTAIAIAGNAEAERFPIRAGDQRMGFGTAPIETQEIEGAVR
jgi:hypothetical protein